MIRYDWLKNEISRIPRRKFHILETRTLNDLRAIEANYSRLPSDYREFVIQCGEARLFRSKHGRWHNLIVHAPPLISLPFRSASDYDDGVVRLILGHYINTGDAWLELRDGAFLHEGAVCCGRFGRKLRTMGLFEEWFRSSFMACHKLYKKKDWHEIMQPAPPFSEIEKNLLDAMLKFGFRKIDVTSAGMVRIEIKNESLLELPYFTIGVQSKNGMTGAIGLRTSGIMPGMSKIIERHIYKGSMDPHTIELFRLPLPEPEDRQDYFEFNLPIK